jgi:hypothetical protein
MTLRALALPVLAAGLFAAGDRQVGEANASALPANANDGLAVVELYQSQGCSSCPPAIPNVNRLADRDDLLVLMFSVTYWDYLGWKDTYGKPAFTARQAAYAKAFAGRSYTPQVVVNGRRALVGDRAEELASSIAKSGTLASLPITRQGNAISLAALPALKGRNDLWLVRYDPRNHAVAIRAGENSGRTIDHRNIVMEIARLGSWSGEAKSLNLPQASKPGLATALLVQAPNGGRLLAAVKLRG